jgi:hypothetical protein
MINFNNNRKRNIDYIFLQILRFLHDAFKKNILEERLFIYKQYANPGIDVFSPYLAHYFTGMLKAASNVIHLFFEKDHDENFCDRTKLKISSINDAD